MTKGAVLIVGCGDVGLRVARELGTKVRRLALTSSPARLPALRAAVERDPRSAGTIPSTKGSL